MRTQHYLCAGLVVLILLATAVVASTTSEVITGSLISSGGGRLIGDGLTMETAVGQPLAGTSATERFTVCSGFLCEPFKGDPVEEPPPPDYELYLPAVLNP